MASLQDVFSGNRVHVGPDAPSSPVPSRQYEPSPEDIAIMAFILEQHRIRVGHAGVNPFSWIRKFKPETPEDVGALFGLAHDLADPDLSPQDLQNIAGDVLRNPKLRKFFF